MRLLVLHSDKCSQLAASIDDLTEVKLTTQWDYKLILLCLRVECKSNLRSFKIPCERMSPQTTNFVQKCILKWPLSPLPMRLIMSPVFLLLPLMVTNLKQVLQSLATPIRNLKLLGIILLPLPLLLLYIISFLNILNLPHLLICPPHPLLPLYCFSREFTHLIMASLHCMSFNCRGWNSDLITLRSLVDSFDACFVQEHWLISNYLYKLNDNMSRSSCRL